MRLEVLLLLVELRVIYVCACGCVYVYLYPTENKLDADVWVLNSCTVKSPSEDHFRNEISTGKKLGKYVVLAGCVPQAQPRTKYMQVSLTVYTRLMYCAVEVI